ncbi:MAG: nucleotidyltransferase [Anaerolineae bacterium]|nr:nucleotidyltransferase [Anaerolineae bacterium]
MADPQVYETIEMIARRLDEQAVDWMVFAGAAAAIYGAQRPLTDVDVLVPASQGEKVAHLFLADPVYTDEGRLLCIKLPGADIVPGLGLFDVDEEMLSRVERHEIEGVSVPVIPVEDNVLLKAMMGRGADEGKHDWEDVAAMLTHSPQFDWDYLLWRAQAIPDQARVDAALARLQEMRSPCLN